MGDKLVIELNGGKYALDTALVTGIVEVERIPFLPGQTSFVGGIISLRGEPVAVINLKKALGINESTEAGPKKVIVIKEKNKLLGIDIGGSNVSFLWEEELKKMPVNSEQDRYTDGVIDPEGKKIKLINWAALMVEAARILSANGI